MIKMSRNKKRHFLNMMFDFNKSVKYLSDLEIKEIVLLFIKRLVI